MPYILPSDLRTRQLAGDNRIVRRPLMSGQYIGQRFPLPTMSGDYRSRRVALSGGVVPDIYTQPPYRSLALGGFMDESTMGVPNKYLVYGGLALFAVMALGGGRRRRR